jgi:hypothetical protein
MSAASVSDFVFDVDDDVMPVENLDEPEVDKSTTDEEVKCSFPAFPVGLLDFFNEHWFIKDCKCLPYFIEYNAHTSVVGT